MKRWKLFIRKSHRILSVIIGVQILFWMVSGAYFSIVPIKTVRGEDRMSKPEPVVLSADQPYFPIHQLAKQHSEKGPLTEVRLRKHSGEPVYALYFGKKLPDLLVHAHSGEPLPSITQEQAQAAALADYGQPADVRSAGLLEGEAPPEYKGPMPVYQIALDDGRATRLYVYPVTGEVLKRRNRYWRVFDFLWMLHIMDFKERDNFNNNLLRILSLLGLTVVISGYGLWATSRKWRRNKPKPV